MKKKKASRQTTTAQAKRKEMKGRSPTAKVKAKQKHPLPNCPGAFVQRKKEKENQEKRPDPEISIKYAPLSLSTLASRFQRRSFCPSNFTRGKSCSPSRRSRI